MKVFKTILFFLIVFANSLFSLAGEFLLINPNTRGSGQAAFVTTIDIGSLSYNPAGLSFYKKKGVYFTHIEFPGRLHYEYLAGSLYIQKIKLSIGGSAGYLFSGQEVSYDSSGNESDAFITQNTIAQITIGKSFFDIFSFGWSAKFVWSHLFKGYNSYSYLNDFGFTIRSKKRMLYGAISVQNIGLKLKSETLSEAVPIFLRIGGGIKILKYKNLIFNFEIDKIMNSINFLDKNSLYFRTGVEYNFAFNYKKFEFAISPRIGYTLFFPAVSFIQGVSTGIGLRINFMRADFAWLPYDKMGNSFRFSIGIWF